MGGGESVRGVLRLPNHRRHDKLMPPSPTATLRPPPRARARRGFSIIELAVALGIGAILTALALPSIDFNRFRMDSNARLVQNKLLWAQSRAVQRNMQVLVEMYYARAQFRIVEDSTADGLYTNGERVSWTTLSEAMKFATPPTTIDAVTPFYATGAGISNPGDGTYRTMIFYPSGSSSGDAVIYLGSPRARLQDNRAIKISGATSKMYFYRMGPDGVWRLSDM
jgi:prepilin-type N-terminal cleavage/methylation domain-containing protein